MPDPVVAIHVPITTVPATVDVVCRAEEHGVPAVWLSSGGYGPESLTVLAVIGAATRTIVLGSSVAVSFSRHPLIMAQQSLAISDVAPGRFRLGIGSGHRPTIEDQLGLTFDRPLGQVREYVAVLRSALAGQVHHDGERFRVHARLARPHSVPIYLSALRATAYRLAGEIAEGAISWVTPPSFLAGVAAPALRFAAADAGRPAPRLVGHAYGLVTDDIGTALQAGRERLASNTRMAFYQRMFADAGYPEARDGTVPSALLHEVVLVGDEQRVSSGVQRFLEAGCDEIVLSVLPGSDHDLQRTLEVIGRLGARSAAP